LCKLLNRESFRSKQPLVIKEVPSFMKVTVHNISALPSYPGAPCMKFTLGLLTSGSWFPKFSLSFPKRNYGLTQAYLRPLVFGTIRR
jgi:hypothetical protein